VREKLTIDDQRRRLADIRQTGHILTQASPSPPTSKLVLHLTMTPSYHKSMGPASQPGASKAMVVSSETRPILSDSLLVFVLGLPGNIDKNW
jgi:hypothetical protein